MIISRDIDRMQWETLVEKSSTASWFQTPQAYDFFLSVADELTPYAFAVVDDGRQLKGVCVGYIVGMQSRLSAFFSARSIIIGGPLLADDITDVQLEYLLNAVNDFICNKVIYSEIRNFSDYTRWRNVFERCGYLYQPHYNYLSPTATIDDDIDRNRRRNIGQSSANGLVVELSLSESDINDFYALLQALYRHRLHLPLFSRNFFRTLVAQTDALLFVAKHKGRVVGGELCVKLSDKTLYDWYGCGDNTIKDVHPSEYVTYKAILWARDNHVPLFDFMGAGSPDRAYGVRDFKARFGGQLVEFGRYISVLQPAKYQMGSFVVNLLLR